MEKYIKKAAVLLEALSYIQDFREAVVVIKLGGSVIENRELTVQALRDIVFMECVGMRPVIVHGGGKAISAKLKEKNIPVKFINGLRYTCERTINVVDDVLHNDLNKSIVEFIKSHNGRAKRLSGKKILKAKKTYTKDRRTGESIDLGYVGEVYKVTSRPILDIVESDVIPVITPLAEDTSGQIYNVNADIAAAKIAEFLSAKKLVYMSDVPGILKALNDEKTLISTIKQNEIDAYIEKGIISGGMLPKIESALKALKTGTDKIHMIDGRIKHSLLLEIFTDNGIGTQILKE
ncbi:MAG: acetylglutamate kinase [Victivallales bacterium]|nr:acetylglutamate kinase [Victivallales bacterium]